MAINTTCDVYQLKSDGQEEKEPRAFLYACVCAVCVQCVHVCVHVCVCSVCACVCACVGVVLVQYKTYSHHLPMEV